MKRKTADHPRTARFRFQATSSPYVQGASTILDIFGTSTHCIRFGTFEDDQRRIGSYFGAVGDSFSKVLSRKSFQ